MATEKLNTYKSQGTGQILTQLIEAGGKAVHSDMY
jgi:hypothetical protein